MAICEVCGNSYANTFTVFFEGREHVFDAFECAIHALAPRCQSCRCTVIGHGVEHDGRIFCCAFCARKAGVDGLVDHN
ncbi:hypothetical protein [Fulvimonas soli]|jgi:hypothetical protein|uniref:Metallothionein n=1 Tax=Fulvimonas soli TaxID=155197 RepID=A0A316IRI9_9GAMM|nr:hypothetical protein [Fulvimonas soli]PWK89721.1 metallothionein [Fulvimonas soli]TNY27631.1 hypothetical protein BV497_02920 [Fulvimonas soli]